MEIHNIHRSIQRFLPDSAVAQFHEVLRGVRVYARCAMGMPGSETALEELLCRVLGDLPGEGVVAKLADDICCRGKTITELQRNVRTLGTAQWAKVVYFDV